MAAHAAPVSGTVRVHDGFGVCADAALPSAAAALDAESMAARLAALAGPLGGARLEAIEVTRHKPGKRCVVEYTLCDAAGAPITLLGKIRSSHRAESAYKLMRAFRAAGFDESAPDGICVAEPVACFADLGMWLQRKVPGTVATELLAGAEGAALAVRIAQADWKIQHADVRTRREHTLADELRILDERLALLAQAQPAWAARLARLLEACRRRAAEVPATTPRGVHRDYYADQILVAGPRLYVIDFDLYCSADAALDMGNFIGHVIEQALRERGHPGALDAVVEAARARWLALAGAQCARALDTYVDLTLVRHIQLATLFESRRHLSGALLALCEARFAPWMS